MFWFPNLLTRKVPILAHCMPWWGRADHRNIGYKTTDPRAIVRQLRLMQMVGISGVIVDWPGSAPTFAVESASTGLYAAICAGMDMKFCIMIDQAMVKWRPDQSVSPTQEIINQINANKGLFTGPTYLAEGYVLEFGLPSWGVDFAAVDNALNAVKSGLRLVHRHTGYTWPEVGVGATSAQALATLTAEQTAPNNPVMACGFMGFNDTDPNHPGQSIWGGTARVIDPWTEPPFPNASRRSLLELTFGAMNVGAKYLQLATWSDYEEGTAVEPNCEREYQFGIVQ